MVGHENLGLAIVVRVHTSQLQIYGRELKRRVWEEKAVFLPKKAVCLLQGRVTANE